MEQARCPECGGSKFRLLVDDKEPDDTSGFWVCFNCHYQESALVFVILNKPQQEIAE